jgi:hypothetical protein
MGMNMVIFSVALLPFLLMRQSRCLDAEDNQPELCEAPATPWN